MWVKIVCVCTCEHTHTQTHTYAHTHRGTKSDHSVCAEHTEFKVGGRVPFDTTFLIALVGWKHTTVPGVWERICTQRALIDDHGCIHWFLENILEIGSFIRWGQLRKSIKWTKTYYVKNYPPALFGLHSLLLAQLRICLIIDWQRLKMIPGSSLILR